MEQYQVTGMSCAACSARVEKAVSAVPGVTACSVSLLTNSMGVEGSAAPAEIIRAVEEAGYGASKKGASAAVSSSAAEDALRDTETPRLRRRLFASLGFLLVLMYFSMGVHMAGFPAPAALKDNHVALALLQQHFGIVKMPGGFFLQAYPVVLRAADILWTVLGVEAVGFLISLLSAPRRQAG